MPQLQFYLDEDYIKKLAALQEEEDKSLQLAAKRLLISLLDNLLPDSNPKDIEELKRRLDLLENRSQSEVDSPPSADLEDIKQRLSEIENNLKQGGEIIERINALENEISNSFIAYKDLRDALESFPIEIQGYEEIASKCLELFKNQEARLKALEESQHVFSHKTEIIEILRGQETRLDILKTTIEHLAEDRQSHLKQSLEIRQTLNGLITRISEIENNLKEGRSQKKRAANGRFLKKGETNE